MKTTNDARTDHYLETIFPIILACLYSPFSSFRMILLFHYVHSIVFLSSPITFCSVAFYATTFTFAAIRLALSLEYIGCHCEGSGKDGANDVSHRQMSENLDTRKYTSGAIVESKAQ